MLFMQASQHQRQNFRSKTALPHLTQFLHNATLEIRNSAQMISCIPVLHTQTAHFYRLRFSAVYLASKPSFTRDSSGHSLGNLTAALFDV